MLAVGFVPAAASGRMMVPLICGARCGGSAGARELAANDASGKAKGWLGNPRSVSVGGVSCEGPYGDARRRTQWTCNGTAAATSPRRLAVEFQINLGPFGEITYEHHVRY